jgi:predicted transcriptional regulator
MADEPLERKLMAAIVEQVAEIVAGYLSHNTVAPADVPNVISTIYAAMTGLTGAPRPVEAERTPAVPVRRSITPETIICLDCGWKARTLKRHLTSAHSLTPDDYRARWNLSGDYPMVAPAYSSRRSEMAKAIGLGKGRAGRPSSQA